MGGMFTTANEEYLREQRRLAEQREAMAAAAQRPLTAVTFPEPFDHFDYLSAEDKVLAIVAKHGRVDDAEEHIVRLLKQKAAASRAAHVASAR